MNKHALFFCFCLLALAACNDNAATTDEVVGDEDVVVQPAVPAVATLPTKGPNYEVKVVDDKIKSPRKELSGTLADVPVVINYGSPAVNDRTIFGDLVPYNKVWRTGANEATRITFNDDVMVGESNKKLPAGTYALFTLPTAKDDWSVIFNRVADQWGAYDYDEAQDVARIKAKAVPIDARQERMDFVLTDNEVMLMWDDLGLSFPVSAASR